MGKLNELRASDLRALGSYLTRGTMSFDRMSGPDIATYIEGRYSPTTLADALRVLRSQGLVGVSTATGNSQALGLVATTCGLPCPTGMKDEHGADVTTECELESGHDGPCRPKGKVLTNALREAMRKKARQPKWEEVAESMQGDEAPKEATQVQAEDDSPTPDDLQVLEDAARQEVSQPTKPEHETVDTSDFVTHKELGEATESLLNVIEEAKNGAAEKARKLLSADLEQHLAGIVANIPNRPVVVEISLPELPEKKTLKRRPHAAFQKVLRLARAGLNVMLIGPAGSGKTTLAEDIALALDRSFYFQSFTAGMSEGQLVGRLLPLGNDGAMRYVSSPFVCGFAGEKNVLGDDGLIHIEPADDAAGVVLCDEVDGGDANTLMILNAALANGRMTIEARAANGHSPIVTRHKNCIIIAAANTFGTGMDLQYAGRNALDAAFLDRWYPVYVTYDPLLEAQIADLPAPAVPQWQPVPPPSPKEWQELARWVLDARAKIESNKLRKVWGTRALQKAKAARYAGIPSREVKNDLLLGWPPDQAKILLGGY